jgi:hypothetical protein
MSRLPIIAIILILLAGPALASETDTIDRSFLWRSEEAAGHVLPDDILANWPRDAVYGYDIDHIHLEMGIDFVGTSISASCWLTITITEPDLLELPIDLNDALTVSQATFDGAPVIFAQAPEQVLLSLAVAPGVGTQHTLHVDYSGTPL